MRVLPILIGMIVGATFGVCLSWFFPPEFSIDRTFYFVVHGGLLAAVGLLGGYIWMLLAARSIRLIDAIVVILLVLTLAGFFLAGTTATSACILYPILWTAAVACIGYLFASTIVFRSRD